LVILKGEGNFILMPFEIIDEFTSADVAFKASGKDIEELFVSAAGALLSIMLENPNIVSKDIKKRIDLKNSELDLLLYEFLQELIFYKDSELLLLVPESITISKSADVYLFSCDLAGEKIKREKHHFNVDAKAITMHKLKIEKQGDSWIATVIVDV
jgi:SHS2 domain-containing protein